MNRRLLNSLLVGTLVTSCLSYGGEEAKKINIPYAEVHTVKNTRMSWPKRALNLLWPARTAEICLNQREQSVNDINAQLIDNNADELVNSNNRMLAAIAQNAQAKATRLLIGAGSIVAWMKRSSATRLFQQTKGLAHTNKLQLAGLGLAIGAGLAITMKITPWAIRTWQQYRLNKQLGFIAEQQGDAINPHVQNVDQLKPQTMPTKTTAKPTSADKAKHKFIQKIFSKITPKRPAATVTAPTITTATQQ